MHQCNLHLFLPRASLVTMPEQTLRSPLKPDLFHILLALESGPLHGYGIVASVEEQTDSQLSLLPSLLYRRLARLVESGVVRVAPDADDSDPRRKYYELTDRGRSLLRLEADRIVRLGQVLESYRWSVSS